MAVKDNKIHNHRRIINYNLLLDARIKSMKKFILNLPSQNKNYRLPEKKPQPVCWEGHTPVYREMHGASGFEYTIDKNGNKRIYRHIF